jgi:hypothetical protein
MGDSLFSHKLIPIDGFTGFQDVVDISGRFFVGKDVALTLGAGLQINSGDEEGTYLSVSFGARKYLSTNDFAPFVGGQITYAQVDSEDAAGATIADVSLFDLAALFGAEYFFNKNFSLEGAIGVGLGKWDSGNADGTYLGTRTVGVHANFYF